MPNYCQSCLETTSYIQESTKLLGIITNLVGMFSMSCMKIPVLVVLKCLVSLADLETSTRYTRNLL